MTPNEYGRWYKRLAAALATVGMTVSRSYYKHPRDSCWLATNGSKGNYSALNIAKSPGKNMAEGASIDEWKEDGLAQQLRVAPALAEFHPFCAVDFFKDIRGKWHGWRSYDQLCLPQCAWEDTTELNKSIRSHFMATKHELHPALGRFA